MKKDPVKRLPPNIWAAAVTSSLMDICSEMLVCLVPLFLENVLDVRTAVIGLIDEVAKTTASLAKILSGRISDRLGRRKWLAVLG